LQNPDHGFLALVGQDGQLDPALLDVEHGVGDVALHEHVLAFLKFENRLARSDHGKKGLRVKRFSGRIGGPAHGSLPARMPPSEWKLIMISSLCWRHDARGNAARWSQAGRSRF